MAKRTFGQFAASIRGAVQPGAAPGVISPENPPVAQPDRPVPVPAVVAEADAGAKHPVYDAQDGEDPDSGHAHLMHDLGTAIQEMMAQDPETHKSMSDLMEQFMGKGVDYEAEGKRLRGLIEARKTPKQPNWLAAGVGSWAGGPAVANKFEALRQAATGAEKQKQADMEDVQSQLLKEHVEDLRSRGKTKEALLMGLMSGAMAQKRTETQEQGKGERHQADLASRAELQDKALAAAGDRLRAQIAGHADVADKERAQKLALGVYRSLLNETETDKVTGAKKHIYTADEALQTALQSVIPALTHQKPPAKEPAGAVKSAVPTPVAGDKVAAWKAKQAAARAAAAGK